MHHQGKFDETNIKRETLLDAQSGSNATNTFTQVFLMYLARCCHFVRHLLCFKHSDIREVMGKVRGISGTLSIAFHSPFVLFAKSPLLETDTVSTVAKIIYASPIGPKSACTIASQFVFNSYRKVANSKN